jgi:3' terminal RNA ribose 2'-O-methyltransferase Hen1
MLLTISTTHRPATDLGYLLHKHPERTQSFDLPFGKAQVFYTEATAEKCTAAMVLDIDPIALKRRRAGGFELAQYVNDRPYVASSLMSVALARVYGSALKGQCDERPDLAMSSIPLRARISALPCRDGAQLIRSLFEPLGYTVEIESHILDDTFPEWGDSPYHTVSIEAQTRLGDLLTHLYVLIPVLDDDKHYYVSDEEIDKLLSRGEGWLNAHPERDLIVERYLKHQHYLKREALDRLRGEQSAVPGNRPNAEETVAEEEVAEQELKLHQHRLKAVLSVLEESGASRVLDLGCGPGRLLEALLKRPQFVEIVGMDISHRALERAAKHLQLDRLPPRQRQRLQLIQGSLTYRDSRLAGYDAAALSEVIEHLEPSRLAAFERVIFEFARPGTVVITTPNADYNVRWPSLPAGRFRHDDHRFEWTRAEFAGWAQPVADRFSYRVRFLPVGPADAEVGAPTQMAVFTAIDG